MSGCLQQNVRVVERCIHCRADSKTESVKCSCVCVLYVLCDARSCYADSLTNRCLSRLLLKSLFWDVIVTKLINKLWLKFTHHPLLLHYHPFGSGCSGSNMTSSTKHNYATIAKRRKKRSLCTGALERDENHYLNSIKPDTSVQG